MTLLFNWAVKPFSMAALGWLFIGQVFRPTCRRGMSVAAADSRGHVGDEVPC